MSDTTNRIWVLYKLTPSGDREAIAASNRVEALIKDQFERWPYPPRFEYNEFYRVYTASTYVSTGYRSKKQAYVVASVLLVE